MNEEILTLIFIPPLVYLLGYAERNKGEPLKEEEVINIRDNDITMTISRERKKLLEESRGYVDIDPENCWQEWQEIRRIT